VSEHDRRIRGAELVADAVPGAHADGHRVVEASAGQGDPPAGRFQERPHRARSVLSRRGAIEAEGEPARGDLPLTGDWDGDGKSDLMVYRPSTSQFFPRTQAGNELPFAFPFAPTYGRPGDLSITGDWDDDGVDDIGVFRPGTSTGGTGGLSLFFP
jgi:hypothetical protein